MEQTEGYSNKLENLEKALESFRLSLEIDLSGLRSIVINTIRSGQIQNFEFSIELLWKTCKSFLEINDGIVASSPKQVIKELEKAERINENTYETLFDMLKDRNLLSHIYNMSEAEAICAKLPNYFSVMLNVLEVLKGKK